MFCFTYGDGVSDVNLDKLIEFHKSRGQMVTLTAVQPTGRFGNLSIDDNDRVLSFSEKPDGDGRWINGGFLILSPSVGDYLVDDSTVWEREPIEVLAKTGEVGAYKHTGFWHPMDTVHDKESLESIWNSDSAPWKVWE
jgi:glucose-1-phosphate cytidylyltransferase